MTPPEPFSDRDYLEEDAGFDAPPVKPPVSKAEPVWRRLGYDDPDVFAIRRMREHLCDENYLETFGAKTVCKDVRRGSGCTYRMLFAALTWLEAHPSASVGLVVHDVRSHGSRLTAQLKRWAAHLGHDPARIVEARHRGQNEVEHFSRGDVVWFTDHAAGGSELQ